MAVGAMLPAIWSEAELVRQDQTISPGLGGRLTLMGWTLAHYVDTIAWPFRLSPLYALPSREILEQGMRLSLGGAALVAALLVIAWVKKKRVATPLTIIILLLVALAPFINLIPLYYLVADRYLLLPSIAVALGTALVYQAVTTPGSGVRFTKKPGMTKIVATALAILILGAYVRATISEGVAWRTSESLWRHAVSRQPASFYARLKLGETLRDAGKYAESVTQYRVAKQIRPLSPTALGGIFWGTLLVDAERVQVPSKDKLENMTAEFISIANDIFRMRALKYRLDQLGFEKTSKVVTERIIQLSSRPPST
jgi:hypothetical protein